MLVKALRLRHLGERISPEELRRCAPMLGNLRVEQDQLRRLATRGSRMALLMPLGGSCEPLAQLHSARLILVDHRGLVIQGIEESWRRKQCTDHRQALWCWPVDPRKAAQHDGCDAIDLEEEKACIADAVWGRAPRSIDEGNTGMPPVGGADEANRLLHFRSCGGLPGLDEERRPQSGGKPVGGNWCWGSRQGMVIPHGIEGEVNAC